MGVIQRVMADRADEPIEPEPYFEVNGGTFRFGEEVEVVVHGLRVLGWWRPSTDPEGSLQIYNWLDQHFGERPLLRGTSLRLPTDIGLDSIEDGDLVTVASDGQIQGIDTESMRYVDLLPETRLV